MSLGPMKMRCFAQGVYDESSTKKEDLGTLRIDHLGQKWRYARAGTTALAAGRLVVGVAINAAHAAEAITAAVAIGTRNLTLAVTSGVAIAVNELAGGQFIIDAGTGIGHSYVIDANTAITTATTSIDISLKRGLKVALDTTSTFTLARPEFYGAIISTTQTLPIIGVTPIAVTASYYFWALRNGLVGILTDTTVTTVGAAFAQGSNTSGSVTVSTSSDTIPDLGQCIIAGAAGAQSICRLNLE